MTGGTVASGTPRGLLRLGLRLPVWLYRLRLGRLLGRRFVMVTHTGRKSGRQHQTVLEVVRYDPATGVVVVASGWGEKADWFRNILKHRRWWSISVTAGSRPWLRAFRLKRRPANCVTMPPTTLIRFGN